jgi:NNMT/PNMT/TEMT family
MKQLAALDALRYIPMAAVDTNVLDNADAPWNRFSSHDYWRRNYEELHAEDQEIITRVSHFLKSAFADRPHAQRAIDVGSGTNLYPALLMLPWTDQILLADYSDRNVSWLQDQIANDIDPWAWRPFWGEMREAKGYSEIDNPREQLREACASESGYAGIERLSIFDLPNARFDLGTMFFVAESITDEPEVFRDAVEHFVGTLKPGAPFAAAFMAGSDGYKVADTVFPAVPIAPGDVMRHLTALGVCEQSVELLKTSHRVRDGYTGMIVATGFTSNRSKAGEAKAGEPWRYRHGGTS